MTHSRRVLGIALLVAAAGLASLAFFRNSRTSALPKPPPSSDTAPGRPRPPAPPSSKGRLTGTVRRAKTDKPLGDVEVRLSRLGAAPLRSLTAADGRFVFPLLDPGPYVLQAQSHPRAPELRLEEIAVAADQEVVQDLWVETGPVVTGKVTTWDGRVPKHVALTMLDSARPRESEAASRLLDPTGSFQIILGFPRGKCSLQASAPGYADSEPAEFDASGDVEGLVLKLTAGGGLFGVVEDEARRPVPGAVIGLQAKVDRPTALTARRETADPSGRFTFRALSPGVYFPSVSAEGYTSGDPLDPVTVRSAEDSGPVTLRVRRGWSLWGRVVSRNGQPIGAAEIDVTQGAKSYAAQSKPDGSFRLDGINPGSDPPASEGVELLKCQARGFGTVYRSGLPPGREVTLVLRPGGGIALSVALSEGPAPKDFSWMLAVTLVRALETEESSTPASTRYGLTGPRGEATDLVPGTYEVEVSAAGRRTVTLPGVQVSPGSVTSLETVLAPGRSTAPMTSLRFKDAATLRSQLQTRMTDLDPEQRQALIDFLRSALDGMPTDHPSRRVLEEVLKDYPK